GLRRRSYLGFTARVCVRCSIEYSSIDAWPHDSTNRSRFAQIGSVGSKSRNFCHSVYATGASAIGVPGWPEFAAWTASMASVRIVLMHFKSRDGETLMGPPRLRVRERLRVVPVLGRPVAYKPAAPRWQPKTLADQVCRQS